MRRRRYDPVKVILWCVVLPLWMIFLVGVIVLGVLAVT